MGRSCSQIVTERHGVRELREEKGIHIESMREEGRRDTKRRGETGGR